MKLLVVMLAGLALLGPAPHASPSGSTGSLPRRHLLATLVAGGQGAPNVQSIQGVFGAPSTFATHTQLTGYGFRFGPSDGQFGAIPGPNGTYTFYGAAGANNACAGAPNAIEGAFTFTGTLNQVTGGNGCQRLFGPGDGPAGWIFDRDYAGGGQVVPFASGDKSGYLMVFHGEFHWSNAATADQQCAGLTCFYSSLGLAVSTDGGKTFTVVGAGSPAQPAFIGFHRQRYQYAGRVRLVGRRRRRRQPARQPACRSKQRLLLPVLR
jgi:hypothetical protein